MLKLPSITGLLLLASLGSACLAADDGAGALGSAFRPQLPPAAPAPVVGTAAPGSTQPSGLRVVLVGPGRSLATIDGKIVRVGDTVNGMRVTQIDLHGVVLAGEGGKKEALALNPSVIKRPCPEGMPCVSQGVRP